MTVSLLQRILQESENMHRAERRVADFVVTSPSEVIQMSMASLSEVCSVSDPTIMRFCRRFGFEGYQDLKLQLAQSLVPSAPFAYEQIIPNDSIAGLIAREIDGTVYDENNLEFTPQLKEHWRHKAIDYRSGHDA